MSGIDVCCHGGPCCYVETFKAWHGLSCNINYVNRTSVMSVGPSTQSTSYPTATSYTDKAQLLQLVQYGSFQLQSLQHGDRSTTVKQAERHPATRATLQRLQGLTRYKGSGHARFTVLYSRVISVEYDPVQPQNHVSLSTTGRHAGAQIDRSAISTAAQAQ